MILIVGFLRCTINDFETFKFFWGFETGLNLIMYKNQLTKFGLIKPHL